MVICVINEIRGERKSTEWHLWNLCHNLINPWKKKINRMVICVINEIRGKNSKNGV